MLIKKFSIIMMFIMISCKKEVSTAVIQSDNTTIEQYDYTNLREQLQKASTSIKINRIDFDPNLLVSISYSKKNIDQIALLAMLAKEWAPLIFSHDTIASFTIFHQIDITQVNAQHFITIERADWLDFPTAQTIFEWYNLASRYYIGPAIIGNLTFRLGNIDVFLPVQKPIN